MNTVYVQNLASIPAVVNSATSAPSANSTRRKEHFATSTNNPLVSALNILPLSHTERREVIQKIDSATGPLSDTSLILAQQLASLPNKKSTTLATLFLALQIWAEYHLGPKDLVILHAAVGSVPLLAGTKSNVGISIVCNSRSRQSRISHAAELLLAAILGYFRTPICLNISHEQEISHRFFNKATVLVHGSEHAFEELQNLRRPQ